MLIVLLLQPIELDLPLSCAGTFLSSKIRIATVSCKHADKSIERRLQALDRKFPPGEWNPRAVSFEDLESLEQVLDPSNDSSGKPPKISMRLVRLITKLESDAQ